MEKTLFQIIASSGESKSKVFEALEAYQKGDNKAKNRLLKESEELLAEADSLAKTLCVASKNETIRFLN